MPGENEEITLTDAIQDGVVPVVAEEEQVPQTGDETAAAVPPQQDTTDWSAKEQLFKEQLSQYETEIKQYKERMAPYEQFVQQMEQQRIDQLGKSLEDTILQQNANVTPEQRQQLGSVLRAGIQYMKEATLIKQERQAAAALKYASDVLGDAGTIAEWKKLAGDMYKLENPQLMERYAGILKGQKQQQVREERVQTGADNVIPMTPRTGQAMTFAMLEKRFAEGTASPKEEELYIKEYGRRKAAGLIP